MAITAEEGSVAAYIMATVRAVEIHLEGPEGDKRKRFLCFVAVVLLVDLLFIYAATLASFSANDAGSTPHSTSVGAILTFSGWVMNLQNRLGTQILQSIGSMPEVKGGFGLINSNKPSDIAAFRSEQIDARNAAGQSRHAQSCVAAWGPNVEYMFADEEGRRKAAAILANYLAATNNGRFAVVGTSGTLIRSKRGKLINAHEVVIRTGQVKFRYLCCTAF